MEIDDNQLSITDNLIALREKVDTAELEANFCAGEKQFHSSLNRLGRAVDNVFDPDPSKISFQTHLPVNLVLQWILEHILRQGNVQIAEILAKEAGISLTEDKKRPFVEIAAILTALKQENCSSALEWAQTHADRIEPHLIFQLHKLEYVRLLHKAQANEAFDYARKFFSNFLQTENREVQRLMAAILFVGKLDDSPYADLNDLEALKSDVMFSVGREYCKILNMTPFSPLLACVQSSALAISPLLKARKMMDLAGGAEWTKLEQLPVEIELPNEFVFHTTFRCPVSKEATTADNPPMLLPCGHVISKKSLCENDAIMSRSQFTVGKLKCPYCPQKLRVGDAREIIF
eukprot:TRINITY_DN695_c0_g1_i3.p1 TRINITY_DN695_c0_g1~~TRINITY_DN695_c0_g1_i3.p1  ORF type:complete len:397 (+),score=60.47 TRINITY_DN695_c0_g1_i3:152-1192(+)